MNQFPPTYGVDPGFSGDPSGGMSGDVFQPQHGPEFFGYNEVNLFSNGKMGMDPSYASPNWMANMRPQYGGPAGFDARQAPQFTFMGAVRQLGYLPTWNDPVTPSYMSSSAYYGQAAHDMASKPVDYGMNFAQNFAIPVAGFMAGTYLSGLNVGGVFGPHKAVKSMHYQASMARQRLAAMVTGNAVSSSAMHQAAMTAASRHSFGAFAGRMVGASIGRVVGGAAGAVVGTPAGFIAGRTATTGRMGAALSWGAKGATWGARGLGFAGSLAGSAAGWLAFPMAFMAAADVVGDQMANAYVGTRQGMDALLSASSTEFTGQTMYGTGMNRGVAAQLGGRMARESILKGKDGSYMAEILNMGTQMGMYEDVNFANAEKVLARTRSISKQVSLLMKIANEPNVQEAMKMVSDLQRSGIVGKDAEALITSYGSASAISGVSGRRIMETVGKQGQAMAQMAGMSPFIGQMQAASAYAGIANAAKLGLVGPSTLALMGGIEGATQAFTGGTLRLSTSVYNQATSLWGGGRGVVGNLSAIGNRVAADPMKASAELFMLGGEASAWAQEKNIFAPYQQVFDLMKTAGLKANEDNFVNAARSMGLQRDEIRSALVMMKAYQDPASRMRMQEAMVSKDRETMFHTLEQAGYAYTGRGPGAGKLAPISRAASNVKTWWAEQGAAMANDSAAVSGWIAGVGDYFNRVAWGDRWGVGPNVERYRYETGDDGKIYKVSDGGLKIDRSSLKDKGFSESSIALASQMSSRFASSKEAQEEFQRARGGSNSVTEIQRLVRKYSDKGTNDSDILQTSNILATARARGDARRISLEDVKSNEEKLIARSLKGVTYKEDDYFFGAALDPVKAGWWQVNKGLDRLQSKDHSQWKRGEMDIYSGVAAMSIPVFGGKALTDAENPYVKRLQGMRGDVEEVRGAVSLYRAGTEDPSGGRLSSVVLKDDKALAVASEALGVKGEDLRKYLTTGEGSKEVREGWDTYSKSGWRSYGNAQLANAIKKGGKEGVAALMQYAGVADEDRAVVEEVIGGLNVGSMDEETAGRLVSALPTLIKERQRYKTSEEFTNSAFAGVGLSGKYTTSEKDDTDAQVRGLKDKTAKEDFIAGSKDFREGAGYLLELAKKQGLDSWTKNGTATNQPAAAGGRNSGSTNLGGR